MGRREKRELWDEQLVRVLPVNVLDSGEGSKRDEPITEEEGKGEDISEREEKRAGPSVECERKQKRERLTSQT